MSPSVPDGLLRPRDEGRACLLNVRAQPGARVAGKLSIWNGRLKLSVAAAARAGDANRELLAALAGLLGLRRAQLELAAGPAQRDKSVRIDAPYAGVRARLEELLAREGLRP